MKTTRHSLLAKGLMVLLSLLVLVFLFTYGWFTDANAPATASGISISTSTSASIELAIGFTTPLTEQYYISDFTGTNNSAIDFENINVSKQLKLTPNGTITISNPITDNTESFNLLSEFKPIDLTGNGADKLYRPEMTAKNRAIDYTAARVNTDITENKQYICFDLYTRSDKADYSVSLDLGSYVVAAAEVSSIENQAQLATEIANGTYTPSSEQVSSNNYSSLVGSDVTRKSTYGDFSEDSVVGAVRVAFTQYSVSAGATRNDFFSKNLSVDSAKSRLWIPRSDIYLQDVSSSDTGWTLLNKTSSNWTTGVPNYNADPSFGSAVSQGNTKSYEDTAKEHWFYDSAKIAQASAAARYTQVTDVITDISTAENKVIINSVPSISCTEGDKIYYYGKCRVSLWIEGCDAEARRAIDGGSFFFGFDLTAN